MARLFRTASERRTGLWRRVVDLALTDVRVAVAGVDDASLEELEERLLAADFGVPATLRLVGRVEAEARRGNARGAGALRAALEAGIREILAPSRGARLAEAPEPPTVHLLAGVNGAGKTTTVAKLAHHFVRDGRTVTVAAADTFRAGAVEQLEAWTRRAGADFVRGQRGGDPAAVAFDALEAAISRDADVVLVDTAGRLHTHRGLMDELRKIARVIGKRLGRPPDEALLVLDATVGQNAVRQVGAFRDAIDVTGLVLAKMDSSARGGIVVALQEEYGIPVKLVGVGEGIDDLATFEPDAFVEGVFEGA